MVGHDCSFRAPHTAPALVSCSSLTASIQISLVNTEANQGPLEIVPGSHAFDAAVSDRSVLEDPKTVKLQVAVPAGTVAICTPLAHRMGPFGSRHCCNSPTLLRRYADALHLIHRGSANTHTADRPHEGQATAQAPLELSE